MQPQSPQDPFNSPQGPPPQQHYTPPPQPTPAPTYPTQAPQAVIPQAPAYDFIVNPNQPKPKTPLLGNSSLPLKVGIIAGGLVVLLIIFSILRGLLGGGNNMTPYIGIMQDQQALIHLLANAQEQKDLSAQNEEFVATAKLSLVSGRSTISQYIQSNGQEIDPKQLGIKISASTDSQLTAAAEATTFNKTFREVMAEKLATYSNDLQQLYNQTSGTKGKAILSDLYDEAELLQKQLKQ
ncbi:MAG: hypothetical protein AAB462_00495 [Patescibacteria group bacterium]